MIFEKIIQNTKKNKNGLPLDKYIEICLFDKEGYYNNSIPIGSKGDFITSPEISQLFGEILGLYLFNYWQKNIYKEFNLIELGPGNGTLISDILRITKSFSQFQNNLNLKLVEINKSLIEKQKINLDKFKLENKKSIWHKDFIDIKPKPSMIIANEFFDCFPTKQFIKINSEWFEKYVKYNKIEERLFLYDNKVKDKNTINELEKIFTDKSYKENEIIEVSKSRDQYFEKLCKHIKINSGILVIIDYGYDTKNNNSTIQSVRNQKKTHIFDNPGLQDISSYVNFQNFMDISKKNYLKSIKILTQRDFLLSNGIIERKEKIISNCKNNEKEILESGYNRIVSESGMGCMFKCLIVSND